MSGKEELKNAGLKVTLPRLKILEILANSQQRHMSAEQIHTVLVKTKQEVGLATVYRVLSQFEQADIVKRLNFEENQAVFELFDEEHHDHLICVKCGKVEEFIDEVIEQHQEIIASKHNYELTDHSLCLYGICPNCQ